MALPAGAVAGDEVVRWLDAEQAWHTDKLTGVLAWAFLEQDVPLLVQLPEIRGMATMLARAGVRQTGFVSPIGGVL